MVLLRSLQLLSSEISITRKFLLLSKMREIGCIPNIPPSYIASFKINESGTPWYGSMLLDQLNRTITDRIKSPLRIKSP
uniref:Uncharacterized protein n=1 Tax=Meloidogyne incognita TaxID=6306 RepID=A0A914NPS6_MELIC